MTQLQKKHVGNSGDRTFLVSSFPCVGEDFLENTIVCHQLRNKVAEDEVKIQCLLKFDWEWEARFLIIFM